MLRRSHVRHAFAKIQPAPSCVAFLSRSRNGESRREFATVFGFGTAAMVGPRWKFGILSLLARRCISRARWNFEPSVGATLVKPSGNRIPRMFHFAENSPIAKRHIAILYTRNRERAVLWDHECVVTLKKKYSVRQGTLYISYKFDMLNWEVYTALSIFFLCIENH